MRRLLPFAAALCLAATGCSPSDVDPDATVRITGRALDASGRPLADARVLLVKQADLGEVVHGTVLATGTLSTICLLPDPPAVCSEAPTATTDGDGRYELELKGSDTQGTLGTASMLSVVVGGPAAQGSTTISFTAEDPTIDLPDARLWRARASLSDAAVGWSGLPAALGDATYSVSLLDEETGAAFWSRPASGGRGPVDPRLLEDRPATVAVGADVDLPDGSGAGDVRAGYLSARLPLEATAGAPPSRGRPCAAVTGRRARLAERSEPCPLTDGGLTDPAAVQVGSAAVVTGYVVDLGASRPVDLVVTRGFAGEHVVETSQDGTAWRTAGTGLGTTVDVDPPGRPTARFVRVRSPSGLDQSLASEVSVW